jgi:hypothetical protein
MNLPIGMEQRRILDGEDSLQCSTKWILPAASIPEQARLSIAFHRAVGRMLYKTQLFNLFDCSLSP